MGPDPGGGNRFDLLDPKKRKFNIDHPKEFPEFSKVTKSSKSNHTSKFIIIKNVIESVPIQSFNIFLVAKAIESITTEKTLSTKYTRDGNLLILTKNQNQTTRFLKATKLSNLCDIKVQLHPTLNTVKGVVYSKFLSQLSEEEIVIGLKEQEVIECKKITKFVDGKIINTPLHILSFNLYDLPTEINIAWQKTKVEPYFPTPMTCKKCHLIGHTKKHCKSEEKCVVCSKPEHDVQNPCEKVECINCKQEHRSNNRQCPTYKKRQAIIKQKIIKKCTFTEAIQYVNNTKEDFNINSPKESLTDAISYKEKINKQKDQSDQNKTSLFQARAERIRALCQEKKQESEKLQEQTSHNIESVITPSTSTRIKTKNENTKKSSPTKISQSNIYSDHMDIS